LKTKRRKGQKGERKHLGQLNFLAAAGDVVQTVLAITNFLQTATHHRPQIARICCINFNNEKRNW